ncbi:hypothetical protein GCK72_000520 [Caenorhabditis remanei]|uniref:Uncharacterized protein n=1 Tax=Caenorhabditis remanei TaxID=31234 RepID=A0A6A5HQX0_CAERE|nr:hypothetical protein GCK72_000520 [Caenorhabditis remanei]KAF1768707.1 hypothetical protein GCK72_000520 [Caenorhabditis remanei]
MVVSTVFSPVLSSNTTVQLKHRKTSSMTTLYEDLMNTAFYEPEYDFEAEILPSKSKTEKKSSDECEEWFGQLKKEHPLMIRSLPIAVELFSILFITLVLNKSGISNSVDKIAAHLYYFLICFMF